ncbi:hypothetical protein HDE68_004328 [Pedobacter cryoconitis]|uniref:Uncharacterized protein n=1 Tax=Pedobacter cryoconitis TaxID=188932 RepID=A0A7W8ZQL0_9SPHI|nr:DUF6544 family protein [Pedobacter cryoconitis]MBB5638399.1 hypothetical protein [Pedobacter cryoconitis]
MLISAIIIGTLLIVVIIGRVNLSMRFDKMVKNLFAIAKSVEGKRFSYEQLTDLPLPVQRYFKYALKEGQPYISYVSLLHKGQFKTGLDKAWMDIKGEQYFTIEKPGFIWKGSTNFFTARDMYLADKGRLIVSLLSLYNILDGYGDSFNQGELLRWLAESVWFPTNLLPSDELNWIAIDKDTAKLTFSYNGMSLFYIATFNSIGEVIQMETKRYMNKDKMETWVGKLSGYKEVNGIFVPTIIEAIWRLEKGDFSYAKFNVTKIVYDKPHLIHAS